MEETMRERGVFVDHATDHRWAIKMLPVLASVFRRCKWPAGKSQRMDEIYVKVAGELQYLCLGVDHGSHTIDLLRHKQQYCRRTPIAAACHRTAQ